MLGSQLTLWSDWFSKETFKKKTALENLLSNPLSLQTHYYTFKGNSIENDEPWPSWLSTLICPLWASMIEDTI